MQTDRYNGHRGGGLDVNGLMLAGGATVALLFGLTLTAPHFVTVPERVLTTENIRLDPPPPPKPEPTPQPKAKATAPMIPRPDPVTVTRPPVEATTGTFTLAPVETPPNTGTLVGLGSGGVATVPVHVAVERAARLDSRYADTFQPEYPLGERQAEHVGRVVVRVLIGTDGRVKDIQQVSTSSAAFYEATRKRALAKWRFEPATRDGTAIEAWQTIGVRFELDE